ncbi:MAG TPA: hypothetical protein VIK39_09670 [Candidatus Angelobacter sp.]
MAAAPERSKGISLHMLPKRVADISGQKWGFTVDFASHLKPESEHPVLQTKDELVAFVRKQDKEVQENGVWIVTTNPDAYSDPEKDLLEDIKSLAREQHIPLFIARASELPNGWKRYDQ